MNFGWEHGSHKDEDDDDDDDDRSATTSVAHEESMESFNSPQFVVTDGGVGRLNSKESGRHVPAAVNEDEHECSSSDSSEGVAQPLSSALAPRMAGQGSV